MKEPHKKPKHAALKSNPYGNCKVFDKDNNLLFRCSPKRVNWYLKRDLAEVINEDPIHIKLQFETKNKVSNAFLLSDRENKCVVCGSEEDLSKHHIVPRCYRIWFPVENKSHNSHDVLPLCLDCHTQYEYIAIEFKKQLADEFDAPIHGRIDENQLVLNKAYGYARNLIEHDFTIPAQRKDHMIDFIKSIFKLSDVDDAILQELAEKKEGKSQSQENKTHGQIVVESVGDVYAFEEMWREHFVNEMKPKFLPKGWSINYKIGVW
jgi:hypothetical protein